MAMIMKGVTRYWHVSPIIKATEASAESYCQSSIIKLGEVIEFRKPV
jgi:hypothetical protein